MYVERDHTLDFHTFEFDVAFKGQLPVVILHTSTNPGDHTLDIRLITSSGTVSQKLTYTAPNGNEKTIASA